MLGLCFGGYALKSENERTFSRHFGAGNQNLSNSMMPSTEGRRGGRTLQDHGERQNDHGAARRGSARRGFRWRSRSSARLPSGALRHVLRACGVGCRERRRGSGARHRARVSVPGRWRCSRRERRGGRRAHRQRCARLVAAVVCAMWWKSAFARIARCRIIRGNTRRSASKDFRAAPTASRCR